MLKLTIEIDAHNSKDLSEALLAIADKIRRGCQEGRDVASTCTAAYLVEGVPVTHYRAKLDSGFSGPYPSLSIAILAHPAPAPIHAFSSLNDDLGAVGPGSNA